MPSTLGIVGQNLNLVGITGNYGYLQFKSSYTGPTGFTGATGYTGCTGPTGYTGPAGNIIPMDEYYQNTALLLHFNGYNNGVNNRLMKQIFIDDSADGVSSMVNINSTIQSFDAVSPFGDGGIYQSGKFNGTSNYLVYQDTNKYDVFLNDGTSEFFFKPASLDTQGYNNIIYEATTITQAGMGTYDNKIQCSQNNNKIYLYINFEGMIISPIIASGIITSTANWYYVSITSYNNTYSLYIGNATTGTTAALIGSQSVSPTINYTSINSQTITIGGKNVVPTPFDFFNGWITEVRATRYINRYQGLTSITIPTKPFPNIPLASVETGPTGSTGYTGYTGIQGLPGYASNTGATGPAGIIPINVMELIGYTGTYNSLSLFTTFDLPIIPTFTYTTTIGKILLFQTKFNLYYISVGDFLANLYVDNILTNSITFTPQIAGYMANMIDFVYTPTDNIAHDFRVNITSTLYIKFDTRSYISYQIIQLT